MIPRATHIVAYLAGTSTTPAERAACEVLRQRFPMVEVRPSDHLNRNTAPVCDMVWALELATLPSAARNLPFYAGLVEG
ncbi:MAG: hypothetical protein ABL956_13060 [Hyphomonadaceae bacterium]